MKRRRIFTFIAFFVLIAGFVSIGVKESGLLASAENVYTKFMIINEVFKHISEDYVDTVDEVEILNSAIQGMVDQLDPHSSYINPSQSEQMDDRFQGYEGIGISFRVITDKITVLKVHPTGPSAQSGLRHGDKIIAIDGESAIGIVQDDVPKKLKGPRGTAVKVTVEREGWKEPKDFSIVRDKVNWSSVDYSFMMDKEIGYVNVMQFTATTGEELEEALIKLEQEGMKKLILDLRWNSGGYLEAAVKVSDLFLPDGKKIVFTKGRPTNKLAFREWYARKDPTRPFMPMVVMINEASASASEIVAGAVQDWDRGLIVGKTSFGKGLVQTPYQFNDGSRLLLTTARYYTPSGRLIQRDYANKTKEEYYQEARNDSLHQIVVEKTEKNDSLMFKTSLGRTVYGGGGITPDIIVENMESHWKEIFPDGFNSLFIDFASRYNEEHPELKNDFGLFQQTFMVDEAIIQELEQFASQAKIVYNKEALTAYKDHIHYMLKTELASHIWGDDARQKIELQFDEQVKAALEHFDRAAELLAGFLAEDK